MTQPSSPAQDAADAVPGKHLADIARLLRERRKDEHLSIDQLSARAGVSRSTISKVERAEAMPSTTVLTKLANALGMTITQLISHQEENDIVVLRAGEQPLLVDPKTEFVRRCLSPILPGRGIDWSHSKLPPGKRTGAFPGHRQGTEEYIYVLAGSLIVSIGGKRHVLEAGDSMFYKANADHEFHNVGDIDSEFFIVIDSTRWRR